MADAAALDATDATDADGALLPDAEVLVESEPGVYRRGVVVVVGAEEIQVSFDGDEGEGEEEQCLRVTVWPANPAGQYEEDTSALVHLSEATVIENMRVGLEERDCIYQWVGPILLAVNPMRPLGEQYGLAAMQHCRAGAASRAKRPAHPFVLAELALRDLSTAARRRLW